VFGTLLCVTGSTLRIPAESGQGICGHFSVTEKHITRETSGLKKYGAVQSSSFFCSPICLWLMRHADFILWRACRPIKA
jgi:hypothetical protein